MFKGRALLVIDRLEGNNPKDFHWDIQPIIQSMSSEDMGNEVIEAFSCMEYDSVQAPDAAYKMQVGDRIRVLIHFEMHFSYDPYTGEHDFDFYLERQRVLRRQPYIEKRFRKNFYKFWRTSQKGST